MTFSIRSIFNKAAAAYQMPIVKHYLANPIDGLRFGIILLWQGRIKRWLRLDPNFNDSISDSTKIDIVIPAIEKDIKTLEYVLPSMIKNIRHPIGDIIVVSPPSKVIRNLCVKNGCRFVDENTVLPITVRDIKYSVNGHDRSGWVFQQLLKWSGDSLCKSDYFLIADSDTVFVRPQIFIYKKKIIMPCNNYLAHLPYYKAYEKLLGEAVAPVMYFTSHHSLFRKDILRDLKNRIEKRYKVPWYEAILSILDPNEGACVSDYETYGQFAFRYYRSEVRLEHWCNLSQPATKIRHIDNLARRYKNRFKAISFHSYTQTD